ncbi:MAG: hypothetical protein J6D25_03460, partial [Eggerthellaceae bacterium]|nr:hypothetical protein [Eggerthellaceae bacterium]
IAVVASLILVAGLVPITAFAEPSSEDDSSSSAITVVIYPKGGGTVSGAGVDPSPGETVTLHATASNGYVFVNWTDESRKVVSTDADYSFTFQSTCTLTANFKRPLTITAKPQTYTYNGKQQGEGDTTYDDPAAISEKVVVDGLQSGDSISSVILDGEQTEVGVYEGADGIVPSDATINGKSEDESDYVITYVPGKLTIEAAPSECTVTFENWDGTVLQSGKVAKGEVPKYAGDEPTRPATAQCEYLFVGWEPEVGPVTGDATYTAKYDEAPRHYSVIWRNYDGTEFYRDVKVPYGTMPKYEGPTPTKPSDEQFTYAFAGWTPDVAAVIGDATYTAKFDAVPKPKLGYEVVSGASGTWTQGSNAPMVFKIERTIDPETAFSHFTGILMDGQAVPEKDASGNANWTARSGSVIVELQPSYLSTLSAGKHTVTVTFDDADPVSADFTVSAKAATPATGDPLLGASAALLAVALLALGVVAVSVARRRVRG